MNVGFRRFFASFSVAALVAVVFAAPSNAATPTGVGTAGGNTVVAALDAGDLLKLALIGEQSAASLDPAVGTPSATETLAPLTLSSVTLPALNAATVPSVQTTSTGEPDVKNTALLDLASVPGGVLSGTINPATLSSLVDLNGAASALQSTLADVGVLAGVAHIDSASAELGGLAAPASSTANRQLSVDGITVLDLRALLNLLGLDLNKLPLSVLAGLIDQLGLLGALSSITGENFDGGAADIISTVNNAAAAAGPALAQISAAQATVDSATGALTAAQGALAAASAVCQTLPNPLDLPLDVLCPTLVGLTTAVTNAQNALAAAQAALATLQATLAVVLDLLNNLLNGIGDVLASAALLEVEGIQVGATATAADTVANSSALVTGVVGAIKIGGLNLGGLDATATLAQVQALASQITSQLNTILGTISPSLANLVKIDLFKQATEVTQDGDYVKAVAGIVGLVATVTPPDLCALLTDVLGQLPVGGNSLPGVSLPALPVASLLTTLGSVLTCTAAAPVAGAVALPAVPALLNPVTLTAAQANSVAEFKVVAPGTTNTSTTGTTSGTPTQDPLARTGMNETLLLVIGGLMAAVALGVRRAVAPAHAGSRRG